MSANVFPVTRFDAGRGIALMSAGAMMVLLKWVLPAIAPLAVAAYGAYQLYYRQWSEGAIAIAVAIALWYLRDMVGGLLWLIGAGFVGFGLFYLIRSLRAQS